MPPVTILDVQQSLCIAFLTLAISEQYETFFLFFFTKWLPSAILDVRNSLCITFLAILDKYATFFFLKFLFVIFFYKIAAGGHFGCPKITFGRISGHFRSIRNFFFTKWLPSGILDVRNSLWITFLAILDQYRFFNFFSSASRKAAELF